MKVAINEAQAMASLNVVYDNEYIVRYHNAWIEKNKFYLVVSFSSIALVLIFGRVSIMILTR